jgi:hypothetical protein
MDASDWIALFGVISGIIIFSVGLVQYSSAQQWKRAEFVANEIKEFRSQLGIRNAMAMLDWSERPMELFPERQEAEARHILFTDALLKSALTIDTLYEGPRYTDEEIRIRDDFDEFFVYLGKFEQFIQAGLVNSKDFRPYLYYWIKRIGEADSGWKKPEVIKTIWIYIDYYNFQAVQSLFDRFGYNIRPDKSYLKMTRSEVGQSAEIDHA